MAMRRTEERRRTARRVAAGNGTRKQIGTGRRKGTTEARERAADGVVSDGSLTGSRSAAGRIGEGRDGEERVSQVSLAQACLFSIPNYALQAAVIPNFIYDEVERICRNFIWGSSTSQRNCHLIAWDKVCKPKQKGGLGFRSLRVLNEAYLLKLAWSLHSNPDAVWVKILKAKYKVLDSSHLLIKAVNKDSVLWKGIAKICIKPPDIAYGPDYLAWKFSSTSEFTIKTAYEFLTENSTAKYPIDDIFKTIWSWQGPPRVSTFVWKVVHGKLLTNCERVKMGVTTSNLCPRCNSAPETIMHLLRDCDIVAELWESLIDSNSWSSFFSLRQDQWIRKNLEFSNHSVAGVNWSFIFLICIWSLSKDRNSLIFKQKTDLPGNLFFHVISYARRTIEAIAGPSPLLRGY
ncbi:Reverse transcriptase zinc-binding domain [Sesbania bispinosa]|nr:Reverse transcriptase zinc-binding domain [Sesbania bispinosa]